VVPTGTCLLNVSVGSGTSAGTYTLTIRGNNGTAIRNTSIVLQVVDFSVHVSPAVVEIVAGETGWTTVTIIGLGGYSGCAVLFAEDVPALAGTAFSPETACTTSTSNLTFVIDKSAVPGTYTVTVNGVNGTTTHSTSLQLVIRPPRAVQVEVEVDLWPWLLILILIVVIVVLAVLLLLARRKKKKEDEPPEPPEDEGQIRRPPDKRPRK